MFGSVLQGNHVFIEDRHGGLLHEQPDPRAGRLLLRVQRERCQESARGADLWGNTSRYACICVWSCCVKTPHNFCKRYRTSLCSFFACGICALNKWGRNMFLGVLEVLRHVVNMVWPPPCGRVYSDRNVNLKPKRYLLTVVYTYVIFAYKSYPKIATHLWCLIS